MTILAIIFGLALIAAVLLMWRAGSMDPDPEDFEDDDL